MPGKVVVGIKTPDVGAAQAVEDQGGAIVERPYNDEHERCAVDTTRAAILDLVQFAVPVISQSPPQEGAGAERYLLSRAAACFANAAASPASRFACMSFERAWTQSYESWRATFAWLKCGIT